MSTYTLSNSLSLTCVFCSLLIIIFIISSNNIWRQQCRTQTTQHMRVVCVFSFLLDAYSIYLHKKHCNLPSILSLLNSFLSNFKSNNITISSNIQRKNPDLQAGRKRHFHWFPSLVRIFSDCRSAAQVPGDSLDPPVVCQDLQEMPGACGEARNLQFCQSPIRQSPMPEGGVLSLCLTLDR